MNPATSLAKIALVRHGETDWNVKGLIQGQSDIPLNHNGLFQAEQVAQWFTRSGQWNCLFSSHLLRAYQTAEIIGKALNLECIVIRDLMERKFGALEGLNSEERERLYPDRLQNESVVPGLECRPDFKERVLKTFGDVVHKAVGSNAIVVSHGAWINQLLFHISDGKLGSGITTLLNGGICIITLDDNGIWNLSETNLSNHLQAGKPADS